MALAHAATATHAIAEIQAAENDLRERLEAEDYRYQDARQAAFGVYRQAVKAALGRYEATTATIRGDDNDD